jgi:alpha-beta hydrolase superfamily lysophospholipase
MPEVFTREDVTRTPTRVAAAGEICLQRFEWRRPGAARGAVVVVHGLRDHSERAQALAEALAAQGFAVYAQDLRGHGRSGGARQRFDSMDELLGDVDLIVAEARQKNPSVPVFIYGHSLGGLIAASYGLTRPEGAAGIVLSAPALKLFPSVTDAEKSGARFVSKVLPGLKVQKLDDSEFVRTDEAKKAFMADPLIVHDALPARSAAAALDALEVIGARMSEVKVPFLVMHGTADTATNIEGSQSLHEQAASADKTFKRWEGVHHDLLHEPEAPHIIEFVVQWMVARLPK